MSHNIFTLVCLLGGTLSIGAFRIKFENTSASIHDFSLATPSIFIFSPVAVRRYLKSAALVFFLTGRTKQIKTTCCQNG
ncbi:MAG: hypothetical protein IPP49_16230 [Saprospiraceae bacterium]|nr:hypothetical protein [Saprospiraceae bacterium]